MKDYYKVLGVPRSATEDQIKRSYRARIKACHPDVNLAPKASDWTRELIEAYATLSDTEAKTRYDRNLTLQESEQREAAEKQSSQTTENQPCSEPRLSKAEPNFSCEPDPGATVTESAGTKHRIRRWLFYLSGFAIYAAITRGFLNVSDEDTKIVLLIVRLCASLAEKILPFVNIVVGLSFLLLVLAILPVCLLGKGKAFLGRTALMWSYLCAFALWLECFLVVLELCGVKWAATGLLMGGIGVFPFAIVAALLKAKWLNLSAIVFEFLLALGVGFLGKRQTEKEEG